MTDTSRPTVEALITRLRYQAGAHMGQFRSEMDGTADVLGALLTERDELQASRDGWAARMMEFAAAEQKIAEALRRLREHEDTYGGWPQLGVDLHAILRGVQGDAKLSANSGRAQEATEPGFRFRFPSAGSFMRVCPTCGNKRCPHVDTRFRCTGSNEYGQVGVLEATEPSEPWDLEKTDAFGVAAVQQFSGIEADRVPRSVTSHEGVPWNLHAVAGIAWRAGYEAGIATEPSEPDWEYAWEADESVRQTLTPRGPRIQFENAFGTPEELARFPRGQRVRRRKAGPWQPVYDAETKGKKP